MCVPEVFYLRSLSCVFVGHLVVLGMYIFARAIVHVVWPLAGLLVVLGDLTCMRCSCGTLVVVLAHGSAVFC